MYALSAGSDASCARAVASEWRMSSRASSCRPRVASTRLFRVESVRDYVRKTQRLADLERQLGAGQRLVQTTGEVERPAQLDGERREVSVALVLGEHGKRALHLVGIAPVDVAAPPSQMTIPSWAVTRAAG